MLHEIQQRGIAISEDEYITGLRSIFPEEYQECSEEELEEIMYNRLDMLTPLEAEGFLNSVGNFFRNGVAPIAIGALPAVTTIAGTALGGPLGAAAGGVVGNIAANAISSGTNIQPFSNIQQGQYSSPGQRGNAQQNRPHQRNNNRPPTQQRDSMPNNYANAQGNGQLSNQPAAGGYNPVTNNQPSVGGTVQAFPGSGSQQQALLQLLNFMQSVPFLQTLISSLATGNSNTAVDIPTEDGDVISSNYLEMLESLRYLTENAIYEADNDGFPSGLPIETEADKDAYLDTLVENINGYESAVLPDYNTFIY